MKTLYGKLSLNVRLSNECSCSYKPCFPFRGQSRLLPNTARKTILMAFKTKESPMSDGRKKNTDLIENLTAGIRTGLCAITAAALLCSNCPASAEYLTVAFPASQALEVNIVQRTLVEAWGVIRETFVDPTYNHQDWDLKLQQTLVEMFPLKTEDAAYNKISSMIATLGDPFTRLISPKEYQSFRIGSDGNLQGVGLFIGTEPHSGRLIVLSSVDGSPGARADIHAGDELVEIDGEPLTGKSGEEAAQKLRGPVGTSVTIKLRNGGYSMEEPQTREVNLSRETILLSPVSSSIIPHKTKDGQLMKTGYVRLSAFSQTAATDMENVIVALEDQDVHSYILDLRNNPGGLVKAGLDVAQIWLDGNETLVNTIDRDGNMLPINMINGRALTHDPLVVLVNEGSASASEILAGALHDNGRAKLIGHKTFGKGKIQSVTELHDGSALFVTVAKYISPALHEIDQVGISPDVQCMPDILSPAKIDSNLVKTVRSGAADDSDPASSLEKDSCIMVAEHELDLQRSSEGTPS